MTVTVSRVPSIIQVASSVSRQATLLAQVQPHTLVDKCTGELASRRLMRLATSSKDSLDARACVALFHQQLQGESGHGSSRL